MFDRVFNWLGRGVEAGRLVGLAHRLGQSPSLAFQREWRSSVRITHWDLLPTVIRQELRLVCDVGANRGDWSEAILRLAPAAHAIAFEPNPEQFAALQRRFQGDPRIVCRSEAAGAAPGMATFHVERQSELSSFRMLSERARDFHRTESAPIRQCDVTVLPLDVALIDETEISLLKIDVQGFEREVIAGAQQTLQRCRCVVIEVMYEPDYYAGAEGFLGLATTLERETPLRLSCVSAPALAADGFGAWADAVFVHRDLWPSAKATSRVDGMHAFDHASF